MNAEIEHDITVRLLKLIASDNHLREMVREVTALMRVWSGCDAVGIRLRDGEDYPYFETRGFPAEFVRAENSLCAFDENGEVLRDSHGNVVLECMCGNVIAGRFDPALPFFTANGSFWTNGTTALLASTNEADRQARTRNRCNGEGYESVALIPLRHGAECLGLLQFNDRAPGRFTTSLITLLESLADGLALGLVQRREAAAVKSSQATLRALVDAADESVFMIDPTGVVLVANQVSARRLGLEPAQLVGRNIFDLIPPANVATRKAHVATAIAANRPVRFVDQREGIWFEHSIYPVADEYGKVTRLAIYGHDISARVKADEDLRNAEERYRIIIDASPLSILLVRDGRYIYANPVGATTLGYTPQEIIGLPLEETIDPSFMAVVRQRLGNIAAGQPNPPIEATFIRRDGTQIVQETSSVPINLPDGLAALIMGQDVSARRAAEDMVRMQAMVLDQIYDVVTVTDLEGRITYVNEANCRVLKRSREELVGSPVDIFGDDATRGATQREITERTLADGAWRCDVVNYAADGTETILDCRTHVVRDAHAKAVALCGISTDVTEARRIEAELRESEQRFRLLYEQLPVGYQSLDENGRFLEANSAWLEALGYARDEVIGRPFVEFLTSSQLPEFERNFPHFKTRGCSNAEFEMRRKDGTTVTMNYVGRVSHDAAGRFARTHCICTDVTETRTLERQYRQAQKMEAVGRLAAGVAHDFNNQLTVIRGYGDMLLADREPSDPQWRQLNEISRACERARETTSHLLAFSRKQILDPQFTNLGELLLGFRGPVATMIGEDISVEVVAAPNVHTVLVDRTAMHQALMNLVVNARDAMPTGGELVLRVANHDVAPEETALYPELEPGPYVALDVQDTGVGMDGFTCERVFEPFFTTKPVGKGTGLGLPMVQGFVRQSHGTVIVSSEPGRGTNIRILLPAALTPAEPEEQATGADQAATARGTETVLVVEDAAAVRGMVAISLTRAGYRVLEAASPREALAIACAYGNEIDLLVTDMVMPEMNGAELAEAIRSKRASTTVLFISGYHDQRVHPQVADVLMKPFGPRELTTRVRRALDEAAVKSSCSRRGG